MSNKPLTIQKFFGALLCVLCFTTYNNAQKVTVTADRDKILLGEQVNVQLKVEDVNPRTSSVVQWFSLSDTSNHIEVVSKQNIDTVDVNGLTNYIQQIVITSFDSGHWRLPFLQVSLQTNNNQTPGIIKANEVYMDVLPVDVKTLKNYHDIKEIIEVEDNDTNWWLVVFAAITIIALFFLVRQLLKKKKQSHVIKPAPGLSAIDAAMQQLQQLKNSALQTDAQVKDFYIKLDGIYREYIQRSLPVQAQHATAGELVTRLNIYLQQASAKNEFFQVIRLANAVKFAKYIPSGSEAITNINIVQDTIRFLEQYVTKMKTSTNVK